MLRKLFVPFFILLAGCAHLPQAPFEPGKTIPAHTLISDFDLMREALEDVHPGLYDFNSPDEMNAVFDSMRVELTHDMTEPEFLRLIAPLNGKIGCGHTAILPSISMRKHLIERAGRFPCDVRIVGGDMVIFKCYVPEKENLRGLKIVAINDVPAKDLLAQFAKFLPTDGRNTTHQEMRLDKLMRYYYAAFIGMPVTFKVTVASGDAGENSENFSDGAAEVEAGNIAGDNTGDNTGDDSWSKTGQTVELPAMTESAMKTHPDYVDPDADDAEPLKLELRENTSTAVMTIRTFVESDRYRPFLAESFTTIRDRGIKNLILDLRGNGGGEDEYGAALTSYLLEKPFPYYRSLIARPGRIDFLRHTDLTRGDIQEMQSVVVKGEDGWMHVSPEQHPCLSDITPAEPGFRGIVIVLIDGGSFSATSEVAAILHHHRRAKFVGEETGGRYYGNNSGFMTVLTLPGSGIRVILPFVKYTLAVEGYPLTDRGILPDHFVEPTIEDEINGVDRVMMEAERAWGKI